MPWGGGWLPAVGSLTAAADKPRRSLATEHPGSEQGGLKAPQSMELPPPHCPAICGNSVETWLSFCQGPAWPAQQCGSGDCSPTLRRGESGKEHPRLSSSTQLASGCQPWYLPRPHLGPPNNPTVFSQSQSFLCLTADLSLGCPEIVSKKMKIKPTNLEFKQPKS